MDANTQRKYTRQKWINIFLCGLVIFIGTGFASSNKALYLSAITDALDIKRSAYSVAISFRFLSTAAVNLFYATLIKKFGSKKLMLAGCGLIIGSMLLNVAASAVWMFCISEILLGVAFSWIGTPMVGGIINRCCKDNAGTVMGAVLATSGIGTAVAAQVVTPIIYTEGNPFGYRNAYLLVAGLLAGMALAIALFFRELPDGAPAHLPTTSKKFRGQSWVGIDFADARKTGYFYAAAVCIFFCGMCLQGVNGIASAHLLDVGLNPAMVATVASVSSLVLTGSKFLSGFLYDRMGLRGAFSICCAAAVAAMFSLGCVSNTSGGHALAFAYAPLAAMALPLETVMLTLYAKDLFGERSFDRVMSVFFSVNTLGYAVSSPLVNLGFDASGSYQPVLFLTGSIMFFVLVAIQFIITAAHRKRHLVEENRAN